MTADVSKTNITFDSDIKQTEWDRWKELLNYRYLLRNMIIRDLKSRYKNSLLGVFWSFLNPLLMMTVYTLLFTILIPNDDIRQYPVFILVGLLPWNFLSGALTSGTISITSNSGLLKKVYFPRVLLPLSAVFSNFVNFVLSLSVLLIFLFIYRIGITVYALWLPLILFVQIVYMIGLCLLLSALHAYYRDVMMLLQVGLLAWFFLTPIFYPFERIQQEAYMMGYSFDAARIMRWLNPMASIIDGYRTVLWGNLGSSGPGNMDLLALLRTFATAVLVFLIGLFAFRKAEPSFAERL